MYIAPFASVLWFLSVLMLSVYTGRYFGLTYIRRSDVPVSVKSGRYKLVSELRLWTASVRPEGDSMVKRFATGTHESWLYIPTTSAELSISWLSFLWILIPPILSLFWFYEAFIPAFVPFVFNLPLNEIARTQFFVRWVDCNTPFPEYVLSCVFSFSIVFFDLLSVFDLF